MGTSMSSIKSHVTTQEIKAAAEAELAELASESGSVRGKSNPRLLKPISVTE